VNLHQHFVLSELVDGNCGQDKIAKRLRENEPFGFWVWALDMVEDEMTHNQGARMVCYGNTSPALLALSRFRNQEDGAEILVRSPICAQL
jgi:hypothetical protein